MNRRRLLRSAAGSLAIASVGLAGCLGDDDDPPPRKADVLSDVSIADGTMEITLVSEPEVESRKDNVDESAAVASLVVGTARAGSRSSSGSGSGSSGASGRGSGGYSTAPKGRNGWAVYGGGSSSSSWRDDHEDDLETYRANVATLGVAYLGSNSDYQSDSPGPEPVPWDEEWSDPEPGTTLEVDLEDVSSGGGSTPREGWYRVGSHLESLDGDVDFDWQAADFKLERGLDGLSVDEAWHVRPRL